MRQHWYKLISFVFFMFFLLNVSIGESFCIKLFRNLISSSILQIERVESGASKWVYASHIDFVNNHSLFTTSEICNNGIDDDGDGLIDCEDTDCGGVQRIGGIALGSLTDYLFFFADGNSRCKWQGATKGFCGDIVVDGLQANLETSGDVPYSGIIYTNDNTLGAWEDILDQNNAPDVSPSQAYASVGNTALVAQLEQDLLNAFEEINALPVTTGYSSVKSSDLDGLNTQNSQAETFVINITSELSTNQAIYITGDDDDVFILRWDSDGDPSNGYQGEVKLSGGAGVVPQGGLLPSNFINVAGKINSSGGGDTPSSPYPQGPRKNNGLGDLIVNGQDFDQGGFFTGYWLTTGNPSDGKSAALSNAVFVGGWYTTAIEYTLTSGTSGVYVAPNQSTVTICPEICNNGFDDDGDGLTDCDDPDCTLDISKSIQRVSCFGNSDGAINLTINGGEEPYTFDWDNDGTGDNDDTEDLINLSAGTYNVTVSDVNSCSATLSVTISVINEHPYAAMLLTGADNTPFPTATYTGGYYFEFPTDADSFDFSFDHSYIPSGYSLDTNWLGTGTMHYEMTDANTTSNAYQFVSDRVTEFSDFNPGDVPNESGRIYDVYGRGHFTYNSGTDPGGHNWSVTYDFTTMVNGYLPAGTLIGFVDIDGIALNGESVLLTATVPSGVNSSWLSTPPYDFGYNPPEFPHSQPTYNSSDKSYYFNGPSATNTSIAYLTAKDLTSITMELTHGKSGGSYGMKFAGPIYPDTISVSTTEANCIANDGTITFNTTEEDLEFSINNGSTFQNSNIFTGLSSGTYTVVVRNKDTGCERLVSAAPVQVSHNPCQEICNNGIDDDFDGLIDCEDEDCNWIGISNIIVSSCINHPLADIATLELDVDWDYAPPGDLLVVSIAGKSEYIQVDYLAPPQLVTFNIPADGSTNNPITVGWYVNNDLCESTATYNAPESCSTDELACNILYIGGNYLPGDGDAWDAGWVNYLDDLNGSNTLTHVLAKPDATGLGLYDPNSPSTPVSILFSDFDLIIVSATTQAQVSNGLINSLRDAPQVVLNSNYKLLNDFGMTDEEGFYLLQDYAFIDNSTQRTLYKFNNIYPDNIETITHGDYLPIAAVDLWAEAGGFNTGTGGVLFGFDVLDNMPGVAADHGKRVYLGYRMEGVYANAENGGVLPVPATSVFDPVKHLTLLGKYFFDLALVQATSNCSGVENCYNEIDDDGDGLTDCKDPDCTPIPIAAVSAQYRTIKDGTWTNANTWLGGVAPPTGNIQGTTISIEHEVALIGDEINLQNGSKLWVTNGGLEMKGGDLTINGTTVNITNSYLITWSGYDVILTGNKPKLNIANSAVDIGGSFENANGNRVLENVCLTVADAYINSSKDSLRNVCATIATELTGEFSNSVFSQIYLEDTEINIENGDLENNLLASIDGSNLKLWVQNGSVVNAGFWTADLTHHCVSGANGVPAYLLFQPEECTNISWYFDNCDCGCAPPDEVCDSGIDEDGDGLFDCEDDDCAGIVDAGENVASCSGEDVTLTANLISGNGTYTYSWSHGLGSSTSVVVSPTATTVYSVTITNAQGCSSSDEVTVTIGVCSEICTNGIDDDGDGLIDCNDPDCRLTISGFPLSPICYAGNDGSINTTTTGGKNPYTYTWSNGETTEDINQLEAGTYLVTVSDTYGCSATASFDVTDGYQISIGAEIEHSNCYGDAAGAINLSVTGGVQPYSFAWTNGETTEDITSLTAGVYGVTVSDANSCSTTGFYTVFHALNAAYETYYIPLPEQNIRSSFKQFTDYVNRSISSSIRTIISMVATEDGTLLYYDHWEDGYETDIFNPTQSTTEVWGDNVNSNGKPPGFAADLLNTGDVIGMDNSINLPRNPSQIRYDGRDKIVVSHQLALSRAAWAPTPGPVLSGAVDILDINAFGKEYEIPIGEDISSNEMFEYTSALVMSQADNTVVYFDTDGDGSTDFTELLGEGETYQFDGGVNTGMKITSSYPVQVHLITGDYGGLYENRWFTLFPTEKWYNSYFAPVGTTVTSDPAHVFLYNPNNSSITVNYATKSGTGTFNISSKGVYRFVMPMHSGAHFYTNSTSDIFYAVSTIDSDSGDHDAHDWGYNLLPSNYLTVSATIGWGPGNADYSGNGSPAWVIASEPTTLYVDYDGDPNTGSKIDPVGNRYDADYNLTAYESKRVFDNTDNDQTGMYLYTLDGALISVAWGQDPLTAAPGNPYLDFGTTVPPIRKVHSWKEYQHTADLNGDGLVDPGDEITFFLNLQNSGNSPVEGLTVLDQLPPEVTYIPNTTYFNNNLLSDNGSGTPFPADELGYYISSIPINTTYVISFRTTVNAQPPVFDEIINQFSVLVELPCKTMQSEVIIPVVPYTSTADDCSLIFTDEDGFSVSTYIENSVVCVQIEDNDLNESQSLVDFFEITVQNEDFDDRETFMIIETGANTGIFNGCINSSTAEGGLVEDGILFAQGTHTITTSFNDPNYGEACSDAANFILTTDTKPLYFSGAGLGLDRIDPVATNDTTMNMVGIGNEATDNCTVADGFNTVSLGNNDGTENWSGDWEEAGESDDPSAGDIQITNNRLRLMTEDYYPYAYRELDISGSTDAVLTFDIFSSGSNLESSGDEEYIDWLRIEISNNGGSSWTLLKQHSGEVTTSESINISAYTSSNTRIRFLAHLSAPPSEYYEIDNVEINYTCYGSGNGGGSGGDLGLDMAIWSSSGTTEYNTWDGSSFGSNQNGSNQGDRWRIMQGASSHTRDEKIIIGIENGGEISGSLWNGTSWDNSNMTSLADAYQTYWWGCDAAYEQVSGDGMIVWSGGNTSSNDILYQIWNGTSWSSPAQVTGYPGGIPMQIKLAANPTSDEMVLVVNNYSEEDYALVWDGTSWGNVVSLDNTTSQDRTDISVAYEAVSGHAMVVYNGNADANLNYRIWDGTSWGSELTLNAPSGVSGYAQWTVMASDYNSDRLVLGVQSNDPDGWVSVWSGSSWESAVLLTESSLVLDASNAPNVAVAFEQSSGEALATYGRSGQNVFFYRNWSQGSGWSSEGIGTNVGANSNSMRLFSSPTSDTLMYVLQDNNQDLHYITWSGSSWGSDNELETSSGETKNQPFVFLWSGGMSGGGSGGNGGQGNGNTVTFNQISPMCTDLNMPAGGVLQVTAFVKGKSFTGTTSTEYGIIVSNSDDVEEEGPEGDNGGSGYMYHGSSDLELVEDNDSPTSGKQKIGLRFQDMDIPQGAIITNAFLTFNATSADSPMNNYGTTNLTIHGQDADNPGTFTNSYYNVSGRTKTSANTSWSPSSWSSGNDYDSPDLSGVVQEIVDRSGWNEGNSMVFIITGSGHRAARSRENSSSLCPRLTVEYTTGSGADIPENPDVTAVLKHGTTTFATLENPVYSSADETMIWSSILSSGYTLPAGEKVSLEITQNDSGYSFDIEFDSNTKPSKIDLPTQTIIEVEELAVYDDAYSAGVQKSGAENGETVYIRTTVSDPFGPEDITSLDMIITSPSGLILLDTTFYDDNVVDEVGCNKIYEFEWITGAEQGVYDIDVVAHEGYEGITDDAHTEIEIQHADLGSPCQVYFTNGQDATSFFNPDDVICLVVIDNDEDENAGLIETISAVATTSAGDSETVTLSETGLNTGVFKYCINSSSTAAGADNDNSLYAPMGSQIELTYVDPDIDIDECSGTASINSVSPDVDISIKLIKPDDGVALVGEAIQFDITVTNTGPTALDYLLLQNTFDASQLNYTGASLTPGTIGFGSLEWEIVTTIPVGQSFTIETYFTGAAPSNPAISTASVSGTDEFAQAVAAGPVNDDVIITNPLLSIDKYVIDPIAPFYLEGDTITFQIDITNTGSTDIAVLPLADEFSNNCIRFVDANPAADGAGGGVIVWGDLGTLIVGNTTSITTRFVITGNCNPINNKARVDYAIDENGDPVPPAQDTETLPVEIPPVAVDDLDSTGVGMAVLVDVPANDYDLNGNLNIGSVITTAGLLQPSHGSISINTSNGNITYTPASGYAGSDQFEYIICDSTALCDTGLVTIIIINEDCSNGIDDDGDGLIDCDDPDCTNFTNGGLIGGNETQCDEYDPTEIVSLTLPAGGIGGDYEYKWQYSPNGGLSWLDVSGAYGITYDPPVITQTMFFRRAARRFACGAWKYSNFVTKTVTVCPEICDNGLDDDEDGLTDCEDPDCAPSVNASSNLSICLGTSTTISATATGGVSPYTFVWDNGLGVGENHDVTPLVNTTYRVMVLSASGCIAYDSLTVTVVLCPEDCTDGFDNDGDGLIDCDDPDCQEIGQPRPMWDSYLTCPGQDFIEQVIFNDENLQNPSFSIYDSPEKGTVTINYQGVFVYSPNNFACGKDSFIYQVCNQVTGCCDTASVFLNIGDNLPPVLKNVPADITIGCDESIPPIPNLVYAIDVCPGIYISYSQTSTQQAGNTCKTYTLTRTWEATDLCGNKSSASQVVTVQDVLEPEIFRVYTLSNGKKVAGGIAKNSTNQWRYVEFPITFSTEPLVFAQTVTENEVAAVSVRLRNVSKQGFEMRLQEEEDADDVRLGEDVSWMAFQPGELDDESLEAVRLNNITSAQTNLTFQHTYDNVPAFLGTVQTYAEEDPMTLRYRNLAQNSVSLSLQEEISFDSDNIHGNEELGYIACDNGLLTDAVNNTMGEAGSIRIQHNWVTVNLLNSYNKPIVIFGGLTINGSHPSTIRVRNVTENSFEVRIQEWDYLDGFHTLENLSYIVMEGSIPDGNAFYCGNVTTPLVMGEDLFATDNCDEQLLFTSNDSTSFDHNGMLVYRSWTAVDDCGNTTTIERVDTCARAAAKLRVFLNGAYINNNSGLMRDDLRTKGYIPLEEPYSGFGGFTHFGDGGGETTTQDILDVSGEDAIVDWVFVELRSKSNSKEILATRSALMQSDGDIISAEGDSILYFPLVLEDDYFISVRHRNHLGVISELSYYLVTNDVPSLDFSDINMSLFGNDYALRDIGNDKRAMWVGDMNDDKMVIYQGPDNDIFMLFSFVLSQSDNTSHLANFITHGYYKEDVNMDGMAIYQGPNNDRAVVLYNTLLPHPLNSGNLSNFIVQAMLP